MPDAPSVKHSADPQAPLGHLSRLGFALVGATAIDEVVTSLLTDLAALPGVRRVGFALLEGGGRRLRFTASDRAADVTLDWCLIDAYEDVPLTRVVRTGEAVMGDRDELSVRYADFVSLQPDDVFALAVVPLPGIGSPIGGIVVFLDETWAFDEAQRGLLEATARRAADAVRRIRAGGYELDDDQPELDDDSTLTAQVVLDDDPRAARDAREFLREFLTWVDASEEVAATAALCLSELVTNAIVHAGGRIELRATFDTALTVSVRDRGGPAPDAAPHADPDPLRVHGRGLMLVDALADRWGSERDSLGTRVWFSLEPDSAAHGSAGTG